MTPIGRIANRFSSDLDVADETMPQQITDFLWCLVSVLSTREFADRTIVTIAHRLDTILDFDRILVMREGEIAEAGAPHELLSDENSMFNSMLKSARTF